MRSSHVALFVAVGAALLVACNALLGLDELSPFEDSGEAGAGSSGAPSGSSGVSVLPDADAPDANGDGGGGSVGDAGVAPCDPTEVPDVSIGIFVKGGSTGDGRMNSPLGSLAAAIAKLTANEGSVDDLADAGDGGTPKTPTIYVYAGGYTETAALTIENVRRFRIDGAWGGPLLHWTRDCSALRSSNTVINSARARGILINNVEGPSSISNLSLFTAAADSVIAETSRIGIHVIDSGPLTLSNAQVIAENSAPAAPPIPGANGTTVCPNPNDSQAGCVADPAPGADGSGGANASVGNFTKSGYVPATGRDGKNGTAGKMALPSAPSSSDCANSCGSVQTDLCENPPRTTRSGSAGTCGCGGAEGLGGNGGRGGGASVAVLTNGTVNVEYTVLQSKRGGNGLAGAEGGPGTAGGVGAAGTAYAGTCKDKCCLATDMSACVDANVDGCQIQTITILGGQPHEGSKGGKGGNGGNGGGGPSYTVVLLPGGVVNFTASSRSYGSGGIGASPAPNGLSDALFGPLADVDGGD